MLDVGVEADVLNHADLVVRVVDDFEVSHGREIKHFLDLIVACVKFDQMLDVAKVLERSQLIVRHIEILQVSVTSDTLKSCQLLSAHVHLEVRVPRVIESFAEA